jgi:acetoin:2,6-dichlorophenolindophenol oxidoreductase subunit beta
MPETATPTAVKELTYIQAVNEALRWALAEYPEAIVFGEDVGLPGGPYAASRGLHKEFGARVFDTPISESAIIGAAIGAGLRGMRPIVEIMFADFFLVALDQVVNQAANVRYVSQGRFTAPITIRSQQALTPGACAQHTQSLEALFCHVPGIRVALPGNPQDAYELLRTAIVSDDPVVVLESRALYGSKGELRLDGPAEPLGGAHVLRHGTDVTLVSWSRLALEAAAAAWQRRSRGHPGSSSRTKRTSPAASAPRSRPVPQRSASGTSTRRSPGSPSRTRGCPPPPYSRTVSSRGPTPSQTR